MPNVDNTGSGQVQLARRLYEALAAGDADRLRDLLHRRSPATPPRACRSASVVSTAAPKP